MDETLFELTELISSISFEKCTNAETIHDKKEIAAIAMLKALTVLKDKSVYKRQIEELIIRCADIFDINDYKS